MRKIQFVFLAIIFAFTANLYAQDFLQRYDSITNSNISSFMKDWKEWSTAVADTAQVDEYNSIIMNNIKYRLKSGKKYRRSWEYLFSKKRLKSKWYQITHFYNRKETKLQKYSKHAYTVLPYQISKSTYNASRDSVKKHNRSNETYLQSSSTFTPLLKDENKVLYLNDSINEKITHYLGGYWKDETKKNIVKINNKRLTKIRKYIPASYGHWGGYWWFQTMPLVNSVVKYPECLTISYRTSWCSGCTTRFDSSQLYESSPKGEDIESWME